MNSSIEDVLGFKTCCGARVFDQNLEIHLTNRSNQEIFVLSYFDLNGKNGSRRIDTLMPHGEQKIPAGATIAFYCTIEEGMWHDASSIIFYDTNGNHYTEVVSKRLHNQWKY